MNLTSASHSWGMPDQQGANVVPFLPASKPHLLSCNRPRVDDRKAMVAIFYRLRTEWKPESELGSAEHSQRSHCRDHRKLRPRLFQCYDLTDLPRTNNEGELKKGVWPNLREGRRGDTIEKVSPVPFSPIVKVTQSCP